MKTKSKNPVVFGRADALKIARVASKGSMDEIIDTLRDLFARLPTEGPGFTWRRDGEKVLAFILGERDTPAFRFFIEEGNNKLPFVTWSTSPIFTCPGKGECASWCYSLTGWRNAAPFWRQIQNTIALRFMPEVIADAFLDLPEGITLRLYVDGDFADQSTILFWFKLLRLRKDIKAYGYSKSWDELAATQGQAPPNYVLNVSSGGKERAVSRETMLSLPMTRGLFVAVPVDARFMAMKSARYDDPEYHKAVRESARALGYEKVLSCPGTCGQCIKGQDGQWTHACGDMRLEDVVIANGIH